MARYRIHRTDDGSKALIAYGKSIGLDYEGINGDLDGFFWLGRRVALVDFKSKGGELTKKQMKLAARNCPIHFVSKPEQLDALKQELSR